MKKTAGASIVFNVHFLLITIIALGAVAVLSVINKPQTIAQYASGDTNLNTASEIEETINSDRSMGSATSSDNLSNNLPAGYLGEFKFTIDDSNFASGSDLEYLKLSISKAETRLIYLFLPGTKRSGLTDDTMSDGGRKTNQHVNKWETIFPSDAGNKMSIIINGKKNTSSISSPLAGGKYSELRLYIAQAEIKYKDRDVINLNISDKSGIIRVLRPYSVYSGELTSIKLDLHTKRSVIKSGEEYFFNPVITNAVSY